MAHTLRIQSILDRQRVGMAGDLAALALTAVYLGFVLELTLAITGGR